MTGEIVFLFPDQVEDKCHPGLDPGSIRAHGLKTCFTEPPLDSRFRGNDI